MRDTVREIEARIRDLRRQDSLLPLAVYDEAKRLVEHSGGEVPGFVNERFEEVFKEPGLDPTPSALEAHRDEVRPEGARTLARPVPQLSEDGDRKVGTLNRLIATTVAAFLDDITNRQPVDIWDGRRVRPARPGDWGDAVEAEEAHSAAEKRRLLYVALTRARLVVPCPPGELPKGWMAPIIQGFVQPGKPAPSGARALSLNEGGTKAGRAQVTSVNSPSFTFAGEAAQRASSLLALAGGEDEARQAREAGHLWRDPRKAPAHGPVIPRDSDEPRPEGSAEAVDEEAAAFGTLVHKLLALTRSPAASSRAQTAQILAATLGLDEDDAVEATELANGVRNFAAIAAARTTDVVHRDVRTGALLRVEQELPRGTLSPGRIAA